MALYAIGDLHLALGCEKPMDVFGGAWVGYMDKLTEGLSVIGPEDTTVLMGDLSWALDLKGAAKFYKFCGEFGFTDQWILNNNAYEYGEYAICGTRGWFFEESRSSPQDEKVFRRELMRLETSLKAAEKKEKLVFLHYPPRYKGYTCDEILELLHRYEVRRCFYGHLHGPAQGLAQEGLWDGTEFHLLAADRLDFRPFTVIS